ncbi:MAG: helix-turn-helix transcriptional regulator [Ignavibacteriales bacterium]|nr:helix-turn-helix transcriptional regulator [Ignavibacteriales bacterium]
MEWLGSILEEILNTKNIKKTELVSKLNITRPTLDKWIDGQVPKGTHLLALSRELGVDVYSFFKQSNIENVLVPVHRTRGTAKVTEAVQSDALKLAKEYEAFFKNVNNTEILPVLMVKDKLDADGLANMLRQEAGLSGNKPITLESTFMLLEKLGIFVIFRTFPESIKSYAFYTKIFDNRVIFVNKKTKTIDIVFALLHESIHAMRDGKSASGVYDQSEEKLCDTIAGRIQLTDDYIQQIYNTIEGRNSGIQINKLKEFAHKNGHALHGVTKRIKEIHHHFRLEVSPADTNMRKDADDLDAIFCSKITAEDYVKLLRKYNRRFIAAIEEQLHVISDRKLGELLEISSYIDTREIRKVLERSGNNE